MNKLDQQLYEEANRIFEDKVKNYIGDLKADLQQFRKKLNSTAWRFYQNSRSSKVRRFVKFFKIIEV